MLLNTIQMKSEQFFFRAVVVQKSIHFVFSFVSRYITFSSILFLLFS